ncbi:YceD family protein [Acetivibrio mesophilus]|uniref:DUF177 domain-containing protein n=1 Tax=Acetivibrio mesophilus TaxID=2487273 RepID=A0A4V1K2C9_9FIRM|nr:DUF177 domain-containing protein [Acetivibrio mesophilus]RXE59849.1 DUF177 domain-containing protein [Acetivibrio mesophilus]HHV29637.1 DUF177 domain-containing protein [Clostridium sp.]
MKIDISNILKHNGASLNLDFNETVGVNEFMPEEFDFSEPISFKGTLVNAGGIINLDGVLWVTYRTKCSRCLKDIESKMHIVVKEDFVEEGNDKAEEEYTYQGKFLELEKVMIDNIILNLPVKQVCDEACKGYCPKCGADLNENECKCINEDIDPRMEVFKNFFIDN